MKIQNDRFIDADLDRKNPLTEIWENALTPLVTNFSFPFPIYHSYQTANTSILFEERVEPIFLKDGIFSFIPFLAKLLDNTDFVKNTYALPTSMAPIVPINLRKFFVFYTFKEVSQESSVSKNIKLMAYLGAHAPHTSWEILKQELLPFKDKISDILLIRQSFDEKSYLVLNSAPLDILNFSSGLDILKSELPNANFEFITVQALASLDLNNYLFLNTNHFNYFCSQDFLSYFYYFKTNKVSLSFLNDTPSSFEKLHSSRLVRNLAVQFYSYNGPFVMGESMMSIVDSLVVPKLDGSIRLEEYYTPQMRTHVKELANKLFQTNLSIRNYVL